MDNLIKRSDAIEFAEYSHIEALTKEERIAWIMDIPSAEPTVDKDYLVNLIQEAVYDGEACKRLIEMVEPKQGEWIYHKELILDNEYYPSRFECDQCHHFVVAGSDRNFCPNCGCDMRKGADDE